MPNIFQLKFMMPWTTVVQVETSLSALTFSTTAAFVLAGGGVHMAKHGNRSISSKSGSADVLEALGINLDLKPAELGKVFDKTGIVFLFAKNMHPAMKYIMPARLELGIPTIMNLTGPLIHPMALETQLLGISRPELLESTAQVLKIWAVNVPS